MNYFDLYSSYPDRTIAAVWDSQIIMMMTESVMQTEDTADLCSVHASSRSWQKRQ
jgi:hypothetical protein